MARQARARVSLSAPFALLVGAVRSPRRHGAATPTVHHHTCSLVSCAFQVVKAVAVTSDPSNSGLALHDPRSTLHTPHATHRALCPHPPTLEVRCSSPSHFPPPPSRRHGARTTGHHRVGHGAVSIQRGACRIFAQREYTVRAGPFPGLGPIPTQPSSRLCPQPDVARSVCFVLATTCIFTVHWGPARRSVTEPLFTVSSRVRHSTALLVRGQRPRGPAPR